MTKKLIRVLFITSFALAANTAANAAYACKIEDWNIGAAYKKNIEWTVRVEADVSCESGIMSMKFIDAHTGKLITRQKFHIDFYQLSGNMTLTGAALARYKKASSIAIRDIKYRPPR